MCEFHSGIVLKNRIITDLDTGIKKFNYKYGGGYMDVEDMRKDFVEAINNVIKKHLKGFEKGLKNLEVK